MSEHRGATAAQILAVHGDLVAEAEASAIAAELSAGSSSSSGGGTSSSGGGTSSSGGASSSSGSSSSSGGTSSTPPMRTVRVFYLYPSDVAFDERYPAGIANVMRDAQAFFKEQLGKTFVLNDPIVQVVKGEQPRDYYENTDLYHSDKYWWSVFNGAEELKRRFGLDDYDPRWIIVEEISAEGEGAGGGGGGGWVLLPGHDADGGAGYPANTSRWVGGMVHELGHAFGLPDSTSTDGTCMSASFYEFPSCVFTQSQKDGMLNGSYGAFLR